MQLQKLPRIFSSLGLGLTTTFNHTKPSLVDALTPYISIGGVRHKRGKYVHKVAKQDPDGIRHHGFTYFPRFPDQKEPEYEPTKLFMVKRCRSLRKKPYWERHIVSVHLKLTYANEVAIVKNTPEMNAMLYRVKHLVEIKPITFPHGMPTDINQGFLDDHGRFVSYNLLPSNMETEQGEVKKLMAKSVDGSTLRYRLHYRWYQRWD